MNAEAEVHGSRLHGEQRIGGTGHRAPIESDTEGAGGIIRGNPDPFDIIDVRASVGGCRRAPEHGEVAGNATPLGDLVGRRAGDVVGDSEIPRVDALRSQLLHCEAEIHDVTGIVTGRQQHTATVVDGTRYRGCVLGGRRGEDIAHHCAVGESSTHDTAEGWVVAGSTADDHRRLTCRRRARSNHATGNTADIARVRVEKSLEHVLGERRWIVEQSGHDRSFIEVEVRTRGRTGRSVRPEP